MKKLGILAVLVFVQWMMAPMVWAVQPEEVSKDPVIEQRARNISGNLRCLVCQNESIDDSNADLAKDLRLLVRERLVAGDTDQQVVDYLVGRYGEFILLKPVFAKHTAVLWLAPLLVLAAGGVGLVFAARRRSKVVPENAPLSENEKAELEQLLSGTGKSQAD